MLSFDLFLGSFHLEAFLPIGGTRVGIAFYRSKRRVIEMSSTDSKTNLDDNNSILEMVIMKLRAKERIFYLGVIYKVVFFHSPNQ